MLILPLVMGVTLNQRHPALTARLRAPLQYLSMGIFIAFIVLALAANWGFFLSYAGAVAGLVILHNALALGGGWVAATVTRLSSFDRRAITIETGIQNSGLGLVLIFAFFHGLGGMAVVAAFWGIWHAISGLALASVLSRIEVAR
jgi:BASS family bile acid:Na+ symporter